MCVYLMIASKYQKELQGNEYATCLPNRQTHPKPPMTHDKSIKDAPHHFDCNSTYEVGMSCTCAIGEWKKNALEGK